MRVIRIGERYSISTDEVETYDLLPVKTYVVLYNEKDGFYLTEHTNIEVREKIYGVQFSQVTDAQQGPVLCSYKASQVRRSQGPVLCRPSKNVPTSFKICRTLFVGRHKTGPCGASVVCEN